MSETSGSAGTAARDLADTDGPPPGEAPRSGPLARLAGRFGWSLVIEVLNLFTSAFIFIVISNFLSVEDYGRLGGLVAIAAILGPIATFGSTWRLLRKIVVTEDAKKDLGLAVSITIIGTSVAIVIAVAVAGLIIPSIDRLTVAIFLVGQLTAFWLVELAIIYTVGLGRLQLGAALRVVASAARFAGLGAFILLGTQTLQSWAVVSAVSALLGAVAAHGVLRARTGGWPKIHQPARHEYRDGLPFAFGSTTEGFLSASDRPLLLSYGHDAAAGYYAAGYRLVTLGLIPLMALFKAQDRRMFSAGAEGIVPAMRAGKHLVRLSLPMTSAVSIVLFLSAPLLVTVLSEEYADSTDVIRALSVLPIIKGVQFAFGNVLTAADHQTARLRMTLVATGVNLGGNLIFIPKGSWEAAAATTLVAESLLAVLLFAVARRIARRS